jgi:NAD(P)-dependent dehydrogenase (short-subunit alcohol dehydrogenase family)
MIVSECDGIRMATLQNKTALVTGASRGIGRATAADVIRTFVLAVP